MKRRSLDSQGREEIDSGGVLTEKWIVPNVPSPPTIKCVTRQPDLNSEAIPNRQSLGLIK